MKPEDFLRLAEELASKDDEASLRTAISRAYYALFHNGRRILIMHRKILYTHKIRMPRGRRAHYEIPEILRILAIELCNPFYQMLADEMETLREHREKADYEIDKPFMSREEVRELIRKAKNVKALV